MAFLSKAELIKKSIAELFAMKCVELAKNPVQKLRNSYGFPRIFRRHRSYLLGNTASVVQSKKNNSTLSKQLQICGYLGGQKANKYPLTLILYLAFVCS